MHQLCIAQLLACDMSLLVINSLLASLNLGCSICQVRHRKTLNRANVKITVGRSGWLTWRVASEELKPILKADKMVRGVY